MPRKATHRSGGRHKDSATKNTFNPPGRGGGRPRRQTREPYEQDPKRRIGQYHGTGEPPLTKR